ncbi:hypothetical protein HDV02_003481 [Globomyces sp. JEL0801]|nr:hypothetical protein HDV02_003481 [Globomyces sp. JEL0801]
MSSNPQQLMSSPPSHMVLFLLVDSDTGLPYKGTSADKVAVSSPADVIAQFRKAVKAESGKTSAVRFIECGAVEQGIKASFLDMIGNLLIEEYDAFLKVRREVPELLLEMNNLISSILDGRRHRPQEGDLDDSLDAVVRPSDVA